MEDEIGELRGAGVGRTSFVVNAYGNIPAFFELRLRPCDTMLVRPKKAKNFNFTDLYLLYTTHR